MNTITRSLKILFVWILHAAAVHCYSQFPGDVFFQQPSALVTQGGSTRMHVQFFSGATVFGVTMFDVEFHPARVAITSVAFPNREMAGLVGYSAVSTGKVSIAVFNERSLNSPIGTVGVVEIVVSPLVSAGSSVQMILRPRDALNPFGHAFPNRGPSSGLLTVIAAPSTIARVASEPPVDPVLMVVDSDPSTIPLRPPGGVVDLWYFESVPKEGLALRHVLLQTKDSESVQRGDLLESK